MKPPTHVFRDADPSVRTSTRTDHDWRDYAAILVERIWIAVTVFLAVVLVGLIHTFRQVPMYRSVARIYVETDLPKVLNIDDFFTASTRDIEYFNTQVKALYSRSIVEAAIQTNGLHRNPKFLPGLAAGADLAGEALRYVSIEPVPRSRMIDIAVEHPDPELAAVFANALAAQYVEQNMNRRMSASMEAFDWLRRQADEYRSKLEAGRMALHEYRKQNLSVSLEEDQDIVRSKLKAINAELTSAESVRISAEAEWNKVHVAETNGAAIGDVAVLAADELVRQARGELQRKQSEVAVLQTRYRGKHPEMAQAMTELGELERAYRKTCEEAARRVESRFRLARDKEDALRQALRAQEDRAFDLDRKLVRYTEIKGGIEADQRVYDAMLARMNETKIAGDMKTNTIRLLDRATPSRSPFRPSTRRNVLQSILLGLVLGVSLTFGIHFMDDRLRRIEDVEHELGLPVLGVVSAIGGDDAPSRALSVDRDRSAAHAEAFRAVRASLALRPLGRVRRLMVTSTEPREGKSLIASNLAAIFAQDGQKTLLLDGDLRRPFVESVFGKDSKGLSSVLKGEAAWKDAVRQTPIENLSVLTAGPLPENPAELLGSPAMGETLEAVAQAFDRVVVDCPPIFGVSDPLTILRVVEGVIFVVRFNRTGRRAAGRALAKLREGSTPILGIVLNDVRISSTRYGYYRYGYHHYCSAKKTPGRAEKS